ncbi:DUF2357 domain-containing protein [Plantibacter sp. CFBP 8798]|uniref:DUF2357 domain-containing protein n=1 Tax=Plantibacter sp. CFBP 8798 TaxID=2775268 RepID=UPI001784067E|nr:DUF2357 domain-containing protein [Plantibacter sp. CFBP 8798]MBD8467060.1 DUF2357 domain-containing protein [Plantibacter sp. CFBP 8798]
MAQLARVETNALVVEITGSATHPTSVQSGADRTRSAHFGASVNGSRIDTNLEPVIFEERDYELVVRSKVSTSQPSVDFRDPTVVVRQTAVVAANVLLLTLRFRGQVGRTEFVCHAGGDTLTIETEVFPSKMDYVDDYEELIADVASIHRALTLEYLRGTYRQAKAEREFTGSGIEWLSILRSSLDELGAAIQYISSSPGRELVREEALTPIHRSRGSSAGAIRAVVRGLGSGDFLSAPGIGMVRSEIRVSRSFETLDTLEHRWIRSRLKFVHRRLTELELEQRGRVLRATVRSGKPAPRLEAELAEIEEMQEVVGKFVLSPVLSAVTADAPASVTSLRLQTGIGYSQAHSLLNMLSAALTAGDGRSQYSSSDLHELYETWCFLKVARLVGEMLGADVDISDMLPVDASTLRYSLRKGLSRSVKVAGEHVQAALSSNPAFEVPTGIQRPDIVLRVATADGLDVMIVFDAKYRIDASAAYIQQFGAAGAPIDAVNQLHRYRDAIQVLDNSDHPIRPVIAGVALYPWPVSVPGYRLLDAAVEVGIGALPLLPGNDTDLRVWLSGLLTSLGVHVVGDRGCDQKFLA